MGVRESDLVCFLKGHLFPIFPHKALFRQCHVTIFLTIGAFPAITFSQYSDIRIVGRHL